ncbi:MAG: hypothetical protein IJK51_09320 [Bacteroidaceae bacterium]|nr:hypothetical protein [Bacteroidaceae bacterium]
MNQRHLIRVWMLLVWLVPQMVGAASYMKDAASYTAMSSGKNTIDLSLPTFDYYRIGKNVYQSEDSRIKVVIDGDTTSIFAWKNLGNDWTDKSAAMCWKGENFTILCEQYGIGYSNQVVLPTRTDWLEFMLGPDRDDSYHKTMKVRWKVPYEWQGKTIELLAHVVWSEGTTKGKAMDFSLGKFSIADPPSVSVMLMTPMLAFDKEHIGKTMVPYAIQASKVNSMKVTYTNRATNRTEEMTVDKPSTSGFFYLPADLPMTGVKAICNVTDQEGNKVEVTSDVVEVALLHQPKDFKAQFTGDANILLSWTVDYPLYSDIIDGDFWEIQRNLNGSTSDEDSQWMTIGQIAFGQDSLFTYTDEDFLNSYRGNAVSYRVRRMGTSVWGWNEQSGRLLYTVSEQPYLRYLSFANVRKAADWDVNGRHAVELQWSHGTFDETSMASTNIGAVVAMDGKTYATRSEADAQGGGTWGMLCAKEPYYVVLKDTNSLMPVSTYFDPRPYFDGNDVPAGFMRTQPFFRYWNRILIANNEEKVYTDDFFPGEYDPVILRNLQQLLTTPRADNSSFEGLPDRLFYLGSDSTLRFFIMRGTHYDFRSRYYYSYVTNLYGRDMAIRIPSNHYWDPRAKLLLYIDMKNEAGQVVATELLDLSGNQDAISNGRYTLELTRKCVDYDFRMVVRRGASPLHFQDTDADSLECAVKKMETGDAVSYKFMSTDSITNLAAKQQQSTVELTWQNTGGDSDFYRVMRREHGSADSEPWDTLATGLKQFYYIDKKPRPQHVYDYRVESVFQCEGMKVNGQTVTGQCASTGMVRGYVRLADGTGLGGLTVTAEPIGDITGAEVKAAVTDSTGYFEIGGLVYQLAGSYRISVASMGDAGSFEPQVVSFDEDVNLKSNFIFTINTYYIYSGNVYYEGSSIPVPGVKFLRDGVLMVDGNQRPITTDNQGAFSLSIPKGTHRIQAIKDGHVMKNDGYLLNPDSQTGDQRDWNWTADVSTVRLWDQTKVVLHGRVVGGNVQGQLPLGQSLSRNNLGDSIKIVMQLEGDNTSWIVRDQHDETIKERDATFLHGRQDTTLMHSTRRSITIHPDNKTGEYEVLVYPVKYKVTEISATGYSTLFQQGEVAKTLDLTSVANADTATFNRIYHAVPSLDIRQFNPDQLRYFGVRNYTAQDNIGNKATIELWNEQKGYALGHPVFMAGSPYGFMLTACERYYYNNDQKQSADIVNLKGGEVTFNNGLVSTSKVDKVTLDEEGGGSYIFSPENVTLLLTDEDALRSMSVTLLYDGTYYDVATLKAYVMAATAKNEGRRIVAAGRPHLFDILRDPPGGESHSYLESGAEMSYSYTANIDCQAGFDLEWERATGADFYQGVVVVPNLATPGTDTGAINKVEKSDFLTFNLGTSFGWGWTYDYKISTTETIETSSDPKWVGAKADVFIGMTDNLILQDAVAVRAVPSEMYQRLTPRQAGTSGNINVQTGTMKVLARGVDASGDSIYLIRDEVLGVSTKVRSSFAYTQHHIENELLPGLIRVRNSLMLPVGTDSTYAKSLADKQGFPAYISLVDEDDETFCLIDANGKKTYKQYNPTGSKGALRDSIAAINEEAVYWLRFLYMNELEKVHATTLAKNYDFDGPTSIDYSEEFAISADDTRYLRFPLLGFDIGGFAFEGMYKMLHSLMKLYSGASNNQNQNVENPIQGIENQVEFHIGGSKIAFDYKPIFSVNFSDENGKSESWTKKIGFSLGAAENSHLNVDVFRTARNYMDLDTTATSFNRLTVEMLNAVRIGTKTGFPLAMYTYLKDLFSVPVYSGLVFRTRGGATHKPYEDERVTKFYNPGTVLDAKTMEIDKLRIWADQAAVSNVPFDQPARFTIHMCNDTDLPALAGKYFSLCLSDPDNAKGAKVMVDGAGLTGTGHTIYLPPGEVVTKVIEIYPAAEFDYENIVISLYDEEDIERDTPLSLSAHFVPSAGMVKVTTPGNKWVVNTESPYDYKQRGYYLPVRIEGFDVNYRGFDHIELQYKLSTQGDKDWVNVCSFYNDPDLMAQASGVVDSIPADGAIQTRFFGETDPIEQYYDLRAVVYCRYAGGYLTAASPILTGVKDTRRPVPFGTPTPVNGILGIGEDISIRFSEDIAGNYLSKINNFEVLGTPRSGDISTSTCLSFDGSSAVLSAAPLNLTGKSFTVDVMLNPANEQKAMTVFSHGGEELGLKLGLTADRRMTAFVDGKQVTSNTSIPFNGLRQIAYTLEQGSDDMTIRFYDGNSLIGEQTVEGVYRGNSELRLGFDYDVPEDAQLGELNWYKGDMLEFRLWNRALSAAELAEYGQKTLTGYEHGLLCYYGLNEGEGVYSYDHAGSGIDLALSSTNWKRPQGLSMRLDGTDGIRLQPDRFVRTDAQDYTLMFWFNTSDQEATLLANGEAQAEADARNHINVGIKDGRLVVRSGGHEFPTDAACSDGQWHHFAMTVSRSRNVGNIYMDKKLVESFSVDSLGGIMGNNLALGATYTDAHNCKQVMKGYIDEVAMFSSVLPVNMLHNYVNKMPTGTEAALMAYLDFGRSELQDDNTQRLMPTGISLKRYKDARGNVVARRDTLVEQSVIDAHAARDVYAPMTSTNKLDNINFSYVANGNQLLVNLDVPDFQIEKSNVYVTVKEVPDLNGNFMASPLTMDFYVYRNPLRWSIKHTDLETNYGEELAFEATIHNLSGQRQNFELRDLPYWLSASQTQGRIEALDEQTITFSISPYTNIGTYNELISLVGDDGMTEPLYLNVKVTGEQPQWAVSDDLKAGNQMMHIVARAYIDGMVAADANDILAVFGPNQEVMGVANIDADQTANANEVLTFLTVYGKPNKTPELEFRLYDASSGQIYKLETRDGQRVSFKPDAIVGSSTAPLLLENNDSEVETLQLRKGWNWVSLNVLPNGPVTIGGLLYGASNWEPGDAIEVITDQLAATYFCRQSQFTDRGYKWDNERQSVKIDPTRMFRIYASSKKVVHIGGETVDEDIVVRQGWNRIAYLPQLNLPISQAMSVYSAEASEGDVLKSQDDFAILSRDASGNLVWKGTLRYLEAGKGYMLKRTAKTDATFYYPCYYSESRYSGARMAPRRTALFENNGATSMNIVASVSGVELQAGDQLVAFNGTSRVGVAETGEDGLFYLNVAQPDDEPHRLTFCLERDGQVVSITGSDHCYTADAVIGSPEQPTDISFTSATYDYSDGHWYTLDGMRLPGKPKRPGLYIHNGKVTNDK